MNNQFDELTKSLAQSVTRRVVSAFPKTVLLLALATLSATPARAQTTVIPLNGGMAGGTRVTINNGAGDQTDPHVSGDLAVYSDISSYSIRYYSFLTGIDLPVLKVLTDVDTLSDVSGTRISFSR